MLFQKRFVRITLNFYVFIIYAKPFQIYKPEDMSDI